MLEAANAPAKPVSIGEIFPADLKEAFALLNELKGIEPKNEDDAETKAARIKALMSHLHVIQRGLPVVPSTAFDHQPRHRSAVCFHKLGRLAANSPEVHEWLTSCGIIQ